MPHCIIEYAKQLESKVSPSTLTKVVHQALKNSGLFDTTHIKTRAISYDVYQVGDGDQPFIHITIKQHPGRTIPQIQSLSTEVIEAIARLELSKTIITVEITELNSEGYRKLEIS